MIQDLLTIRADRTWPATVGWSFWWNTAVGWSWMGEKMWTSSPEILSEWDWYIVDEWRQRNITKHHWFPIWFFPVSICFEVKESMKWGDTYYYGCDELFARHPDIVKRLIADAWRQMGLKPPVMGIFWGSVSQNRWKFVRFSISQIFDSDLNLKLVLYLCASRWDDVPIPVTLSCQGCSQYGSTQRRNQKLGCSSSAVWCDTGG